ncbi:MAG: ComF family protein [Hyphomicrobiaceae bacterium]
MRTPDYGSSVLFNLKHFATRCASGLLDIVIPPLCVSCHQPLATHDNLCATCWQGVSFITEPVCDRLGIPLPFDPGEGPLISAAAAARPPAYDRARAAAHYSGTMRELIHRFKYGDYHTPRCLFRRWLMQAACNFVADAEIVIPVPLHRGRLIARRFNQAAVLAADLAEATGLRHAPQTLVRRRRTVSQVGLTRDQRRLNLQGAIRLDRRAGDIVNESKILLVDDVITTGTTVDSCARILKRAGARRVDVVALAMATDDSRIHM